MQTTTVTIRTWRERLWSWPWRPWIRERTVTTPDHTLYFNPETFTYYGHPATIAAIRTVWRTNAAMRNS